LAKLEFIPQLVSVIMPVFNKEDVIADSVRSVQAQMYPHWELIIVDDASTDGTSRIIHELAEKDPRIFIIEHQVNKGISQSRNSAMSAARGQYLAFLDGDDLWLPEKLPAQIGFMRLFGEGFTFTEYRRINDAGELGAQVRVPPRVTYSQLLKGNVIGCLTVVIDRAIVPEFQMESVKHEDYVAWLKLLKMGYVARGIRQDLARYRVSSSSMSSDKGLSASWTWKVYRKVEGLSLMRSIWCFMNYLVRALYVRSRTGIRPDIPESVSNRGNVPRAATPHADT